jgi:ABC-2 type transport system permease protein
MISGEYATGMIRTTLTAIPRRLTALTAKATVLSAVALALGTVVVLAGLLAARLLLPGRGFTPAHAYQLVSLGDASTLRAVCGTVLYLVLVALLSLGIATVVRDAATSIGVILALLYLFPLLTALVSDAHLHRRLEQIGPMNAGLAVQTTTNLHSLAISPWAGLGVVAAWAAAAMLAGALSLRLRDA